MIETSVYSVPYALKPNPRWHQIASFFREELKTQPGRLRAALIRVSGTVFAMWVGFALNVPEMGAVLAFAFFASSTDKATGRKLAFGVPLSILAILVIVTAVENIFGVSPLVRFLLMFTIIYTCLFLMQAASNGGMFLLAGVFGKLFLTFWDNSYPAELIAELQIWIVADLALAGLCGLLVCTLFGDPEKTPAEAFLEKLAGEFDAVSRILSKPATVDAGERATQHAEAHSAPDTLAPLLMAAAKKDKAFEAQSGRFTHLTRLAVLLQNQCLALTAPNAGFVPPTYTFQWIGDRCTALAQSLRSGQPLNRGVQADAPENIGDPFMQTTVATVALAEDTLEGHAASPVLQQRNIKPGFLREDALTNPIYKRNAFRVLVASLACYCLMSGAHWSGIGTSMTTCMITALTTTRQARQKQALRILGASIGAVLTLTAIVAVLPHGGGITALTLVTAVITFIGGWVYAGSPRLNYAGVQIVLCFFLGTFGEDKTPTSLTTVRDRVLGIFIGNLAMWLFYDRIQPSWTVEETRCDLTTELTAVGVLGEERSAESPERGTADLVENERKSFQAASVELRAMADPNNYEFKLQNQVQRDKAPEIASLQSSLEDLFSLEYASMEAKLLGLAPSTEGSSEDYSPKQLQSLAGDIKAAGTIHLRQSSSSLSGSAANKIFCRVQSQTARLFSSTPHN